MPSLRLDDRTVVSVRGPEAEDFLQNILTIDLDRLAAGEAAAGALLTPQGKILFDFVISRAPPGGESAFLLETAEAAAADLVKRLTLYKLRAKAVVATDPHATVTVAWGAPPPADGGSGGHAVRDTRFRADETVWRIYGAGPVAGQHARREDYAALRIGAGVAESGHDFALADVFPHDVLHDLNGGVSFRKGCFVGQEVVSRMQHRGTARRRLVIVEAEDSLTPGAAVETGGRAIGTLGTVVGTQALAIVRTDRAGAAIEAGETIEAGGVPVVLSPPQWTGLVLARPAETG